MTRSDWWSGVSLIVLVQLALAFAPGAEYRDYRPVPEVEEETGGPPRDWGAFVREYGTPVDWSALADEHYEATIERDPPAHQGEVSDWDFGDIPYRRLPDPDEVRALADQGSVRAQHALGIMYDEGRLGVTQDYAEAVRWFRLAADQGFAPAQFFLGNSLGLGRGISQDLVEAHKWLNLAGHEYLGPEDRDTYVNARDAVAELMTSRQVAEAQRLAREWAAAHPREPHCTPGTPAVG